MAGLAGDTRAALHNCRRSITREVFTPGSGWTWYVTEGGPEGDEFLFFGFVVGLESEFGYFLLSELEEVRNSLGLKVERDLSFREGRLTDVVPAPDT